MAKFFVISDVHGYYEQMREALDEAGFDPNNEEYWLISCGDHFDRGPDPDKVMSYLMGLHRKVLIRGNHENLLIECCERGEPWGYDVSNGTWATINKLGGACAKYSFEECCIRTLARTHVFLDSMVNYFETKKFVFVHGFIPVNCDDGLPSYYRYNRKYSPMDNWREATQSQWNDAMWLNSYDMIEQGLGIEKCIVAGHFHASYGRWKMFGRPKFSPYTDFSPFYYDDKLIMIDACTAYSHKVNCLVLEDEFL